MSTFQSFEDIRAWQEGRILIKEIRVVCKRPEVRKDFAFVDQITRSARSICANIAEGHDAITAPDFVKFLGYAKRSLAEVQSHFYDALDEGYITKQEFVQLKDKADQICKILRRLMQYLQQTKMKNRKNGPATRNPQLVNKPFYIPQMFRCLFIIRCHPHNTL